ncbi:hypothetical protein T12_16496 [Trichinella patagoniensis]|uniref:Uncharacterized protein n=1 Tax=Trichinella patagoniensis TaxID=990121 RepID=A0A0V0Z9J5_9BILA|nr:hypothetical protein T12_13508 [Trichinella patagoniensis]KRY08730.1 hypothetical protein T12_6284 [Trichinella patagoniensis]KRY20471.1 hypothetical protein T12_16496 [Trichinella patagoniensis]
MQSYDELFRFAIVQRALACFNETSNIQFKSLAISCIAGFEYQIVVEFTIFFGATSREAGIGELYWTEASAGYHYDSSDLAITNPLSALDAQYIEAHRDKVALEDALPDGEALEAAL